MPEGIIGWPLAIRLGHSEHWVARGATGAPTGGLEAPAAVPRLIVQPSMVTASLRWVAEATSAT